MDSANKQSAVVAEVTMGTTPATPAFLLLRDTRISGQSNRSATRSPERRSDRAAANFYKNLASHQRSIEIPFSRDAGTDVLLSSLLCSTWATNTLKNGSTKTSFTLEEKYEAGATDPYKRLTGCLCDSLQLSLRNGEPGSMTFGIQSMAEGTATTAIAGSTYAAPSPGYAPVTPADITVNGLFGLTGAKASSLNLTIANNMSPLYKWGSVDPYDIGLGLLSITGSMSFYFSQLTDYSTFVTPTGGLTLDLTIGSQANFKDQIVLSNCVVANPAVDDPGATGTHMVTLNFEAMYAAADTAAIKWLRNVA